MGYNSLKSCVLDLERNGHLVRVQEEMDPHLEMAEIQRRVYAEHWLPMERAAIANSLDGLNNANAACEKVFEIVLFEGNSSTDCGLFVAFTNWWSKQDNGPEERICRFATAVHTSTTGATKK